VEVNQIALSCVLVIFWRFLELIEKKLLEDVICRANVFVDERTRTRERGRAKERIWWSRIQCGVTRVADFREQVYARKKRFKVRV
jgi:hypothetical protein